MTNLFHKKPNLYTSHIQLKVSNLETSIEFYKTVIGFDVLEKTADTAYLTFDGKTSLVSLVQVEHAQRVQGATGLYHLALLLPTRKDLGNIVQHFIKLNVQIGAGDHDVSEALYLNDPDGNGIEIYSDRPESDWKWDAQGQVFMTTEAVNFESVLADADGTWSGLPLGTVMGHIHLSVSDLAKTQQFYTEVLDFEVVTKYGDQALFISTGKYHHHIGLNTWNSRGGAPLPEKATGLKSFTMVLKDTSYANQVKANLLEAGYPVELFEEAPLFGGAQEFSTVDPNGLRILFTTDGE